MKTAFTFSDFLSGVSWKSFVKRLFTVLPFLIFGLLMTGCGSSGSSNDSNPPSPTYNTEIIGTWISSTIDGVHDTHKTITFHSDKTAESNCSDMTEYTWSGSDNTFTLSVSSSNDMTECSVAGCTSIAIDSAGKVLTTECDDEITVYNKNSDGLVIDSGYLQYRTYETPSQNKNRGWLNFSKSGATVAESDISSVVLKNSQGTSVTIITSTFVTGPYILGSWNANASSVVYSGPYNNFGFSMDLGTTTLPSGLYTYKITKQNGESLSLTLNYPGQTEMPVITASSISYEWLSDGALKLTWPSPSGTFDRQVVYACDQNYHDIFYITLPKTADELVIPENIIDQLESLVHPDSIRVQIQTRLYSDTPDKNNHARGYSNPVVIPW